MQASVRGHSPRLLTGAAFSRGFRRALWALCVSCAGREGWELVIPAFITTFIITARDGGYPPVTNGSGDSERSATCQGPEAGGPGQALPPLLCAGHQ